MLRCVLLDRIWSVLANISSSLRRMYILLMLNRIFCKSQLIKLNDNAVKVNYTLTDFLTFFLLDLPVTDRVADVYHYNSDLSIPYCKTTGFCHIFILILFLGTYMFKIVFSSWRIELLIII